MRRSAITGVNLAGAEFGTAGGALPGTFGSQYTYPTSAEVNYFVGKGMNTFRLPFRWERLQQSQNAAFNSNELTRMNNFVNTATAAGAYVMVDPHNFERYYPDLTDFNSMQSGSTGLIGSASVPISSFTDFWTRMANQYKNNSHVIFNLMNEPNAINTQTWVNAANAAIVGIRSTGATNLILVPGVNWTGASSWVSSNGTAMLNIVDSGNNFAFDMHLYLDDGSGSHDWITNDDPTIGVSRIAGATQWLKTNHRSGFLGEFAVSNASVGGGILARQLTPAQLTRKLGTRRPTICSATWRPNSDAWLGWTWWAGGPWWTSYMFSPEPTNLGAATPTDKPLMAVIQPHFAHPVTGDFDGNGAGQRRRLHGLAEFVWPNGCRTRRRRQSQRHRRRGGFHDLARPCQLAWCRGGVWRRGPRAEFARLAGGRWSHDLSISRSDAMIASFAGE